MLKKSFLFITISGLVVLSGNELNAQKADGDSSEKRTVVFTIYKKTLEKGKVPANKIVGPRNTELLRVQDKQDDSKTKMIPVEANYELDYAHTENPPIRIRIKTTPGDYRLDLKPSFYHPYGGSKYFEIEQRKNSEHSKEKDFVLQKKSFSICTLRAINEDTKQPLSGISFRGYHNGNRVRLYNWKARQLLEKDQREQAEQFPAGTTGEKGYLKFPLWDDIDQAKFKVLSNRVADGSPRGDRYTFTRTRKQLKQGATVSLPIRSVTVIMRPYLRTKEGSRKRLTTDVLRKMTPSGEKDELQDWKLICYKLTDSKSGNRSPYWSYTFDREKAAFVWRSPYPEPGDTCQLNDCIKITTRDGKFTYPLAEDDRRFTVPEEDLPYEGEITVLLDESQLEHPPIKATGTVLTPERDPVKEATVKMINTDTQETKRTATDKQGTFKQKLSPARYKLRISKRGYLPQQATWKVSEESKRKDFTLTPKSKLIVHVNKANGEPVSEGRVRLLPKQKDNPGARLERLHKGKAVCTNLNPGRYTVMYGFPPGQTLESGNIHLWRRAVEIGTAEKKSLTMKPPEKHATVKLRIDRNAADIAEDRPLMLILSTQVYEREIRATGKILGEKNSLTLILPSASEFKPEIILGWTDEAIRKHGGDPARFGKKNPDRYEDSTAYYASQITIPHAEASQKQVIELIPKKETKHKYQK